MRRQGCPELQEPDLLLKVRVSAKDIAPVDETMFPVAAEAEPAQPQAYDPSKPLALEEVDPASLDDGVSDEEAEEFMFSVAKAAVRDRAPAPRKRKKAA